MPASDQPDYLNTALTGIPALGPEELLSVSKQLERDHGRIPGARNAARTLDIDLLLWGTLTVDTPELKIPHPRLTGRSFVLEPLASVAPDMAVPPENHSVAEWLSRLEEREPVETLDWSIAPL